MFSFWIGEPDSHAAMAMALDEAVGKLSTLHPAIGVAWSFTSAGSVALSRSGCVVVGIGVHHAATVVLRQLHLVADSEVAERVGANRGT